MVADKGYHSRALLKSLDGGAWKTRIADPKQPGFSRWRGDDEARTAVYANRNRLGSGVGRQAMRRQGGNRRALVRPQSRPRRHAPDLAAGLENVHKRYLVHLAGHNLGILMRLLIGAGTPREAAACALAYLSFVCTEEAVVIILLAASRGRDRHSGHGR